jgi:parallel beta-helix repeat protein
MNKNIHSVVILILLLVGMLPLTFNVQLAKAIETVYIRPDGSIDPPTAPIERDGDLYTLTGNVTSDADGIVIERDNMTLDGAGYTIQGEGRWTGIELSGRINVTIRNTEITAFRWGIGLTSSSNNSLVGNNMEIGLRGISLTESSDNNSISGNNITGTPSNGIFLKDSAYNTISRNCITKHRECGIWLGLSSNNTICENKITRSHRPTMFGADGICAVYASNNIISGNNITANAGDGITLLYSSNNSISGNNIAENTHWSMNVGDSSSNTICHNNFINNTRQILSYACSVNVWDDGYPSGGNYWSDYGERYPSAEELDGSGIWDTPYEIDEDNQDNYPLTEPWSPTPPVPTTIGELKTKIEELGSEGEIDNQGIVTSLLAKLNVAQKLVDKGKIAEAKSILEEDFIPQVQNLTGIHITSDAADLLIESAEYILSNL